MKIYSGSQCSNPFKNKIILFSMAFVLFALVKMEKQAEHIQPRPLFRSRQSFSGITVRPFKWFLSSFLPFQKRIEG